MKEELLEEVGKLSAEELDELSSWIKSLRKLKPNDRAVKPKGDDWLFDGLVHFMTTTGSIDEGWRFHIQKHERYQIYLRKRERIQTFLSRLLPEGSTRERQQLVGLAASALSSLLVDRKMYYPSIMLSRIDLIPEALENSFPGYAYAGLYSILFPTKERKTKMSRDRFELYGNRILDTKTHDELPKDNHDLLRFMNRLVEEEGRKATDRGSRR